VVGKHLREIHEKRTKMKALPRCGDIFQEIFENCFSVCCNSYTFALAFREGALPNNRKLVD
jgi:hypothetical protein